MASNRPSFPPVWLPVVANILIAAALLALFLALYVVGNVLAWQGKTTAGWPTKDPILEMLLTGVGGVMAALFAVALNLRTSPLPRNASEFAQRMTRSLSFFRAPPIRPRGVGASVTLKAALGDASATPGGTPPIQGGTPPPPPDWQRVNDAALLVIGVVLTLAYLMLAIASAVSAVLVADTAPSFISAFGRVGAGVLIGAFAAWLSGITHKP